MEQDRKQGDILTSALSERGELHSLAVACVADLLERDAFLEVSRGMAEGIARDVLRELRELLELSI